MSTSSPDNSNRREFLTGQALRKQVERAGSVFADALDGGANVRAPEAGDTVRLTTRAMACDWGIVFNPGPASQIMGASDAFDVVHALEEQISVYRESSELSRLNKGAAREPVVVERKLFELLKIARDVSRETENAFDPTSGPLIALWRRCRLEGRIPTDEEIAAQLAITGIEQVHFDDANSRIGFDREGVELNLGAIGKGYAVDQAGEFLAVRNHEHWLIHGGRSSILAQGDHAGLGGWPVGLRNPLLPHERFATALLKNSAMATSGSNIQYFRQGGRRYGHLLDPRTGWPAEQLLSVTVFAPNAALADALSTAFFVGGVEIARQYCDNHPEVGAVLVPAPESGRRLEPVLLGIPDEMLFFG